MPKPQLENSKPCRRGHVAKRYAGRGGCVECGRVRALARYRAKREEILLQAAARYRRDPEKQKSAVRERSRREPEKKRAQAKSHYERNTDKYKAKSKTWVSANREHQRELAREWRRNNPAKVAAGVARKRAAWMQRTPKWLSKEQRRAIGEFYAQAKRLAAATGIDHQVDHVVPLNSPIVSGLHVPWNLQVLTAFENRSKSNRVSGAAA